MGTALIGIVVRRSIEVLFTLCSNRVMRSNSFYQPILWLILGAGFLPVAATPLTGQRGYFPAGSGDSRLESVGFQGRRISGQGIGLTEADWTKWSPRRLGDVLRRLPGVALLTRAGASVIVSTRGAGGERRCPLQPYLDGTAVFNTDLEQIPIGSVLAVEIYRGVGGAAVPFGSGAGACGSLLVWTRAGPAGG
jgi:hypothetical protein